MNKNAKSIILHNIKEGLLFPLILLLVLLSDISIGQTKNNPNNNKWLAPSETKKLINPNVVDKIFIINTIESSGNFNVKDWEFEK